MIHKFSSFLFCLLACQAGSAFELSDNLAGTRKERWVEIYPAWFIDASTIKKSRFKLTDFWLRTASPDRENEVGAEIYAYTLINLSIDCAKSRYAVRFVYDRWKDDDELHYVDVGDYDKWLPISGTFNPDRMKRIYGYVCK